MERGYVQACVWKHKHICFSEKIVCICESVNIRTCINLYDMFNIIMCACVSVLCFVSISCFWMWGCLWLCLYRPIYVRKGAKWEGCILFWRSIFSKYWPEFYFYLSLIREWTWHSLPQAIFFWFLNPNQNATSSRRLEFLSGSSPPTHIHFPTVLCL